MLAGSEEEPVPVFKTSRHEELKISHGCFDKELEACPRDQIRLPYPLESGSEIRCRDGVYHQNIP
jgi:hypothetical protein